MGGSRPETSTPKNVLFSDIDPRKIGKIMKEPLLYCVPYPDLASPQRVLSKTYVWKRKPEIKTSAWILLSPVILISRWLAR